ncbi:MAG: AAA family ATPase [Dehalococcoidia bacterium]
MTENDLVLSPAQEQALEGLLYAIPVGDVFTIWGGTGMGKTTVLREAHRQLGGAFPMLAEFMDAMRCKHPLAIEETFEQMLLATLSENAYVFLDDLQMPIDVICKECGSYYPRAGLIDGSLTTLISSARATGKKLIFGGRPPSSVRERAYSFGIPEFKAADYAHLSRFYLGADLARDLDFEKVYRFAANLNGHQLRHACGWLRRCEKLATEQFIEFLRSQHLVSNVNLEEVQAVDLRDLKGVDDIIESLEANLILPLENDDLATELGLMPKRGVLLAGPLGTGKTTVGRALAHRLKSKFFLVDGTFIAGTGQFYSAIHDVFEAAKQNAPAIIFIDDSDVIFESGNELGLYRYLLTMLDGLESESIGRVCVMLTAMDIGSLPPALVRSGRIELWLETRLPDWEARIAILEAHLRDLVAKLGEFQIERLASASEGLTGADLKRLVEDGKLLYAFDRARGLPLRPPTEYFLAAVETVRRNKEHYAQAEAQARERRAATAALVKAA